MADEEKKKFKCPDCGKEFDSKESMEQHRKDAHQSASASQSSGKKSFNAKKLILPIIVIIVVLGIGGLVYWIMGYSSNTTGGINAFNFSYVPYEGNASAKISIIEFGDYQCPICGEFYSQSQGPMINEFVTTGKAKFYFMDFSFLGPDSFTLAQGAWCANEQNQYYDYHDYIYANQGTENTGWASADKVKTLAAGISGLDSAQFNSCLDSGKYSSRIQYDTRLGQDSQVTGTPTFFIGNSNIGYLSIVGNQPYATFQQTINTQLAKVQ